MDEQTVLQGLTDGDSPRLRTAGAAGVDVMAEQNPGPKPFLSPSSKREGQDTNACLPPAVAGTYPGILRLPTRRAMSASPFHR